MKTFLQNIHQRRLTQPQIAWIIFILVVLAYVLWMSYETVIRYESLKATAFDLGNYDQAIWNTIHGRPFVFTNQGDNYFGPPTRLAFHFEPILLPVSLLYFFYADPRILLVFQTLVLASGALPVFKLSRFYLPHWPLVAPVLAAAYLFSPALMGVNIYDFHALSLATPLLLFAILALVYRRYGWFLLACVLAAACKEDVPLNIAMLGILLLWKYKHPRLGLLLIIGGLTWSALAFTVIMPHFYPGVHYSNFWYRYTAFGASPTEALINVIRHPRMVISTLTTENRFYYLLGLLRSTGFLALLAPEWLLPMLPTLAINLPSSDTQLYSGILQYNAPLIPFVLLAAIHGIQRIAIAWQRWRGEPITIPPVGSVIPPRQPQTMKTTWSWLPAGFSGRTLLLRMSKQPVIARPLSWLRPYQHAFSDGVHVRQQLFTARMQALARTTASRRIQWAMSIFLVAMLALNLVTLWPTLSSILPNHTPGTREQHVQQLIDEIPPDASVSAGTNINPHVSERRYVTVFPQLKYSSPDLHKDVPVDYVIVDQQAVFPENKVAGAAELNSIIQSGQFCILDQAEGVILLKRCGP